MLSSYKRIVICVFLFIISFIYSANAAKLPFINKAKVRLSIPPGQSQYGEIVLENPTKETRSLRAYLEDWYYMPPNDGPKEFLPASTTPLSCASWITFSPAEFTIPAFGRQKINYSVKVPPEAKGGYYAVMFFEGIYGKMGEESKEGVGVGIDLAIRIASLFYVEAEGTVRKTVDIGNLNFKKENSTEPLLIQLDLRNTGNVDITAAGSYFIMDKQGMVVARGEFNNGYTFPGDSVKLTAKWKEPLRKGKYDAVFSIDIGKALEEAGVGRGPVITKEVEIEVGEEGQVIKAGRLK